MIKIDSDIRGCPTNEMVKYSFGACIESLILNSFFGFSMLYYTKALGLTPELAGIATFIATLWDAASDPIMGHISDNTKSRFGKRHPYILIGGIIMIISFFFIWYVPDFFKTALELGSVNISETQMLFFYLVVVNLVLRTGFTIFVVPYTALGFEICNDYEGRSKLQGIRYGLNMAANLLGPAMAWSIFFRKDTEGIKATQVAQNYINMGTVFAGVSLFFLLLLLIFTAKYIKDSRNDKDCHGSISFFFRSLKDILKDKYPRWVFLAMVIVQLGIVLVSTLQIYVFDDFMKLGGVGKSIAHGGTMVGMALGSLTLSFFVKRFGKKGAVRFGVLWAVFCEFLLAALFLTGFLQPEQKFGWFPIASFVFVFFHGAYWFGNGILVPTAISMIADVSEINRIKTTVNKDASYAAMFSLALKVSSSIGAFVAGYCLLWAGFESGADSVQTQESVWRVGALTFIVGPITSLTALALISKYPVTEQLIEDLRTKYNKNKTE